MHCFLCVCKCVKDAGKNWLEKTYIPEGSNIVTQTVTREILKGVSRAACAQNMVKEGRSQQCSSPGCIF